MSNDMGFFWVWRSFGFWEAVQYMCQSIILRVKRVFRKTHIYNKNGIETLNDMEALLIALERDDLLAASTNEQGEFDREMFDRAHQQLDRMLH